MNRVHCFVLSMVLFIPVAATSAVPAPAPSDDTRDVLYSFKVTGQVDSGGWRPCIAKDAAENTCYSEHFDISSRLVPLHMGNIVTMTSEQVRTGYSVEVKEGIVTATCADELHGKPRFSVQGKVGEKIVIKDICEVIVQAGPTPK